MSTYVYSHTGSRIGFVEPNGHVYAESGRRIGRVASTWYVFTENGRRIGRVLSNGYVFTENGRRVGHVESNGYIYASGRRVGYVEPPQTQHGGAALLLLLSSTDAARSFRGFGNLTRSFDKDGWPEKFVLRELRSFFHSFKLISKDEFAEYYEGYAEGGVPILIGLYSGYTPDYFYSMLLQISIALDSENQELVDQINSYKFEFVQAQIYQGNLLIGAFINFRKHKQSSFREKLERCLVELYMALDLVTNGASENWKARPIVEAPNWLKVNLSHVETILQNLPKEIRERVDDEKHHDESRFSSSPIILDVTREKSRTKKGLFSNLLSFASERYCDVCGKKKSLVNGMTCPNGHFVCGDHRHKGYAPGSSCPFCGKTLR